MACWYTCWYTSGIVYRSMFAICVMEIAASTKTNDDIFEHVHRAVGPCEVQEDVEIQEIVSLYILIIYIYIFHC